MSFSKSFESVYSVGVSFPVFIITSAWLDTQQQHVSDFMNMSDSHDLHDLAKTTLSHHF